MLVGVSGRKWDVLANRDVPDGKLGETELSFYMGELAWANRGGSCLELAAGLKHAAACFGFICLELAAGLKHAAACCGFMPVALSPIQAHRNSCKRPVVKRDFAVTIFYACEDIHSHRRALWRIG